MQRKFKLIHKISVFFITLSLLNNWYLFLVPSQKPVQAAYNGKISRTIEYVLGGDTSDDALSDNTTRATTTLVFAGTSWNTTKGSAGTKNIVIKGSGIRVTHAYAEVTTNLATSANITGIEIRMDVANGPAGGSDIRVGQNIGATILETSGNSNVVVARADVTPLFDRQTDSQFNSGLATVGAIAFTGPSVRLTNFKIVITYNQDYNPFPHQETKTVRFPLNSDSVGADGSTADEGTKQYACGASANCDFSYYANMPDLTSNSDIMEVFTDFTASISTASASTVTPVTVNNGSAGTSGPAFNWTDTLAGINNFNVLWRMSVGGNDFNPNTSNQKVRFTAGSVPLELLGGEIIVTYNFSTGATEQTETISYFLLQQTTTSSTSKTTNAAVATYISNNGFAVKNIWYRVKTSPTQDNTLVVYGTVGAASERSNNYFVSQGGGDVVRSGMAPTIYFDLTQDIGSYTSSPTNLDVEVQWASATGDAPVGVEAMITFTWSGKPGTITKTNYFGIQNQATPNLASATSNNVALHFGLPETSTKTYRSAYVNTSYIHSNATSITAGTVSVGVDATTAPANETTVTENGEEGTTTTAENFTNNIYHSISDTIFSEGSTIAWTERTFIIRCTINQANENHPSHVLVTTYDVDTSSSGSTPGGKTMRTVEYVLGGNASATATTDNTSRTSTTAVFAGTSWNTTKASAGTKTVVIAGSGIEVVNAYLHSEFDINTAGGNNDLQNIELRLDVGNGPASGADVRVSQTTGNNAAFLVEYATSDLPSHITSRADVTALFDRQSDGQFNSGLAVVGMVAHTGGTRALTSLKLVITYEQDYTTSSHTETKTVRFPINSEASGDEGSRQTPCNLSTSCDYTYYADIPDAAADADIKDVWFELSFGVASGSAVTVTPVTVNNTTAGTSGPAYSVVNTVASKHMFHKVYWRPDIGGNNFLRSTASQHLRLTMGAANAAIAPGGELVITYNYSTSAATQTETISYYMLQQTSTSGASKTTNAAVAAYISNPGFSVKNIWYKIYAPASEQTSPAIFGTVASGTERSNIYYLYQAANTVRTGQPATLYFDLTQDVANFSSSPTNLDVEVQWPTTTGDAPITVEAYITFTWSGSTAGTVTKTILFGSQVQGTANTANPTSSNIVAKTHISELATKTYRDAYLESVVNHSNATSITASTAVIGANSTTAPANQISITEAGEEGTTTTAEGFETTYLYDLGSTLFSGGSDIGFYERDFVLRGSLGTANESNYSHVLKVTYDVGLSTNSTFTLNNYRWYVDSDALDVTDPWGASDIAENTAITVTQPNTTNPPNLLTELRLRVNVTLATANLAANAQKFRLQYKQDTDGSCTSGGWKDVGEAGNSAWQFASSSVSDGTTIVTPRLTGSDINGVYSKVNPTVVNPNSATTTQDIEYDFHIYPIATAGAATFSFRLVESDGTLLTYTNCPTLTTSPGTQNFMRHGKFSSESGSIPGFIWVR